MTPTASFTQSPVGIAHPPLDGSLFVTDMVEFNATHNTNLTLYAFYEDRTNDIHNISHLEFHRACQRIAHAVRPNRQGLDNEVVAIIANSDTILCHALMMGVAYAGLIVRPLLDGIRTEVASLGDGSIQLQIEAPPALAYAYPKLGKETASDPFVPYPKAEKRPLNDDIMCYLHSSGSTGFPKPIPITYLTAVRWCMMPPTIEHVDIPIDIRIGVAFLPSFHIMGTLFQLFLPMASLKSVSVYAPTSYHVPTAAPVMPNPQNAIETVELLSSLQYVIVGGGPLSKKTGEALVAAGVKLSSIYGATELGTLTYAFRNPTEQNLWEWVRFTRNSRIRWAPQGDGTYECQILTCPTHHPSVENLPDVKGYATSDVFVKHPTVEGLYKLYHRKIDDVLVLSSGEKTVPAPIENTISSNPFLSGVCMFGRGRHQVGILVEPRAEYAIDAADDKQVAEFRNKIWPEVEEANKEAPTFSRIFKEMILVISKEKPMLRTGKGTVMKKATMTQYESEIEALYESVVGSGMDVPLPSDWSQIEVENWLMVHATTVNLDKRVQVDADLFEQGFDSLSSNFLKNRITSSMGASSDEDIRDAASRISQNIIFSNPTIRLLAQDLIQLYSVGLGEEKVSSDAETTNDSSNDARYANGQAVLLTGTTGGLGSYLLASLLRNEDVKVVYAFNRPSRTTTIKLRQRAAFEDRGLEVDLLESEKLVYVEGDAGQRKLGLDDNLYEELRDFVTVIIHNAWRLDFNLSLASFEMNVRGTRSLVDLALSSKRSSKPRFLFTSSISSAQGWDKSKGAFPEEVQYDASVAAGVGYGASKYVCERILVKSGLPASSFRIGQVTGGGPRGAWSTTDWVPIIVKSSVIIEALPEARGVAAWLPPRAVSDAVLDIAFAEDKPPIAVNLVHPRPVEWVSLMKPISSALYQKNLTSEPLPLVPFDQWVTRLEKYAADASEPAIKLLDFFRALAQQDTMIRQSGRPDAEAVGFTDLMTDTAQRVSKTMRELEPLSPSDVKRWVDYWESVGMFSEAPSNV
ncbi:putative aminoadipate reductase [Melanogaster broomeanus]|nr:putative aminoadipate reductase [Melanogaster broomeanus]